MSCHHKLLQTKLSHQMFGKRLQAEKLYHRRDGSDLHSCQLVPCWLFEAWSHRSLDSTANVNAQLRQALTTIDLRDPSLDPAAILKRHHPEYLFFYEALTKWSPDKDRSFRPYATGDPIVYEWFQDLQEKYGDLDSNNYFSAKKKWLSKIGTNHAMHMGNHIGLLGAVCKKTNINGKCAGTV